jgi:DNA-binding MarR family transcriptional regulator
MSYSAGGISMSKASRSESSNAAPLVNPLEELLGYQLRRASVAMLSDLSAALDDMALRPSAASVLLLVGANPGITQSRIGQTLSIERANMVPMTAKLTKQRMLTKSRADGRSHGLHLTELGKKVANKVRRRIADHEERFWRRTVTSDRKLFLASLKSVWTERI